MPPWWRDAVVYQIYPRSFQDADGDGVGDLAGIGDRLPYVRSLGADAVWLSPMYPSPLADGGYDVADFTAVDPRLGTLADLDALVATAHQLGLRVLLDLVACHTSIEHPWFREHPDWYLTTETGPATNWIGAFGGSTWSRDGLSGRWYLHSFYPEQPDLDWRNPELVAAMQDVVRFWLERGIDGFRIDAVDRILKDTEFRDDPPARSPYPLPLHHEHATLEHVYSRDRPEVGEALAPLRAAAGDALLVGEAYVPTAGLPSYLEHLDLVFAFEFLWSPWEADELGRRIEAALAHERVAWVLGNHDVPRLATRLGPDHERLAAMLLLTLPGAVFVYQGDEIGLLDGAGCDPPFDRAGRDGARHPMQWDAGPHGGFSGVTPWLPAVDAEARNVADQERDPGSLLNLYRALIAARPTLGRQFRLVSSAPGVLAYERGEHTVVLNLSGEECQAPTRGRVVLATDPGREIERGRIAPRTGVVLR